MSTLMQAPQETAPILAQEPESENFQVTIEVYVEWDAGDPAEIDPDDYQDDPDEMPRVLSYAELESRLAELGPDDLGDGFEVAPGYKLSIGEMTVN